MKQIWGYIQYRHFRPFLEPHSLAYYKTHNSFDCVSFVCEECFECGFEIRVILMDMFSQESIILLKMANTLFISRYETTNSFTNITKKIIVMLRKNGLKKTFIHYFNFFFNILHTKNFAKNSR